MSIVETYNIFGDPITTINKKNSISPSPKGMKWSEISNRGVEQSVTSICSSMSTSQWLQKHEPLYPVKASRNDSHHFDTYDQGTRRHLSYSSLSSTYRSRLVETPAVLRGQEFAEIAEQYRNEKALREEDNRRTIQEHERKARIEAGRSQKFKTFSLMQRAGQRIVLSDAGGSDASSSSVDSLVSQNVSQPRHWKVAIPYRCWKCGQKQPTEGYCEACGYCKPWIPS